MLSISTLRTLALTSCAALVITVACHTLRSGTSCEDNLTCPKSTGGAAGEAGAPTHTSTTGQGAIGGSASTGGFGGSGGTTTSGGGSSTSSSGGSAGTGGSHGGTSGSGGTSTGGTGALPCDGACHGSTPVCDPSSESCVECLDNDDCDDGVCDTEGQTCVECLETTDCDAGVCDLEAHACVECLVSTDCDEGVCDLEAQRCVECLETTDCTELTASWCDDQSCAPCQNNDDCAHLAGTTVCDVPTGECVECTGTDYASCELNDEGEQLVCDSLTRTCSDQVEHEAGLCTPCVSDAHCRLGQLCVRETFGSTELAYRCFWERGLAREERHLPARRLARTSLPKRTSPASTARKPTSARSASQPARLTKISAKPIARLRKTLPIQACAVSPISTTRVASSSKPPVTTTSTVVRCGAAAMLIARKTMCASPTQTPTCAPSSRC